MKYSETILEEVKHQQKTKNYTYHNFSPYNNITMQWNYQI